MGNKAKGCGQGWQHPGWLVVYLVLLLLLAAAAEAVEEPLDVAAPDMVANVQAGGPAAQVQATLACTPTCGDTACVPNSRKPYDCRAVMGKGWYADWRKEYFELPGTNKLDNGYFCCTQDLKYAKVPTCGNADNAGNPFDCEGVLGSGWVLKEDAKDAPLVSDDVLDAITCCTKPMDASDPVDVYLESDSINQQSSSGVAWFVESVVGEQMQVAVNVGIRGLGQSAAQNAKMRAYIPGFRVMKIAEGDAPSTACTWQTDCPTYSRVLCSWPQLTRADTKTITLTLQAADAGGSNSVTVQFSVNASNVDMNPDNNEAYMTAQLKAACCTAGSGCQNLSRKDCPAPSAFSPAASCADNPCMDAPSPSRDTSPPGICIRKSKCIERVRQMACSAQNGRWRSAKTCKNVRVQSRC